MADGTKPRRPFQDLSDAELLERCRFKPWEKWLYNYAERFGWQLPLLAILAHGVYFFLTFGITLAYGWFSAFGMLLALLFFGFLEFLLLAMVLDMLMLTLATARTERLAEEIKYRQGAGDFARYLAEAAQRFEAPEPPDWILLRQASSHLGSHFERIQLWAGAPAGPEGGLLWRGRVERVIAPSGEAGRRNAVGLPLQEPKKQAAQASSREPMGETWRDELPAEFCRRLAVACELREVPEPPSGPSPVFGGFSVWGRKYALLGRQPSLTLRAKLANDLYQKQPLQRQLNRLFGRVQGLYREFGEGPDLEDLHMPGRKYAFTVPPAPAESTESPEEA